MNTEEKAKAYDEALKDMKVIYPNLKGDIKLAVEHAFPDLAESEDERIRKVLINIVKSACSKYGIKYKGDEITEEKLLAYLEKQKEQKPIQTDAEKEYVRTLKSLVADFVRANNYIERGYYQQIYDWLDGRHVEQKECHYTKRNDLFDECVKNCDPEVMKKVSDEVDAMLKKEQKPATWHGDDGMKPSAEWDKLQEDFRNINEAFENGKKEVVENPEKYGLCKPAEWSEKEKDKLNSIERLIVNANAHGNYLIGDKEAIDLQHFIRSIVKPTTNPAEWSEEDRLHYTNVLNALEYVKGCKSDYDKIEAVKSDIAWLKSLRPQPHWKPSEEQMKAFKGYIEDFQARAEAAIGGWNNFDVMIRLYEQLKKL